MKQLKITQRKSLIGRQQKQKNTIKALGLKKINHTVIKPDRPEIRGMLKKVAHLVEYEEI
jgi:large subunit ribosomal protein L30